MNKRKSRREFLKSSGSGLAAILAGCSGGGGGSSIPSPNPNPKPQPTSPPYSNPSVNSPPFFPLGGFEGHAYTTAPLEVVTITDPERGTYSVRVVSPSNRGGFDIFVQDTDFSPMLNKQAIFSFDRFGNYFPRMISIDTQNDSIIDLEMVANAGSAIQVFGNLKSIYSQSTQAISEQFRHENLEQTPQGMWYLGDWSLADVERFTGILQSTTGVILIGSNFHPYAARAYSVASNANTVAETVNDAVPLINQVFGTSYDPNRRYAIYVPSPLHSVETLNPLSFMAISEFSRSTNVNVFMKNLFPLRPGNTWRYNHGSGNLFASAFASLQSFLGKEYVALDEPGATSFFGFDGSDLKVYGISGQGLEILLQTPQSMGGYINEGSVVSNPPSEVYIEGHPEVTGTVQSTFRVLSRNNNLEMNGRAYGDCFKIEETTHADMYNSSTGQSSSGTVTGRRFYAENIGVVKIDFGDPWYLADAFNFEQESLPECEGQDIYQGPPRSPAEMIAMRARSILN